MASKKVEGGVNEPPEAPKTGAIVVRGPEHGRWRGGRHFSRNETTIPLAELSDDDLAAIQADPVLTHRLVD